MDGDALVGIFAAGVAVPEMVVHFYQRYAEGLSTYLGTEGHARCELLVDRQPRNGLSGVVVPSMLRFPQLAGLPPV